MSSGGGIAPDSHRREGVIGGIVFTSVFFTIIVIVLCARKIYLRNIHDWRDWWRDTKWYQRRKKRLRRKVTPIIEQGIELREMAR